MNKITFNRLRLLETIKKGLQNEYTKYLSETEVILQEWRKEAKNSDEVFDVVLKQVHNSKKQILRKYAHSKTSKYLNVISEQLAEGFLSIGDLDDYSTELKQVIIELSEKVAE